MEYGFQSHETKTFLELSLVEKCIENLYVVQKFRLSRKVQHKLESADSEPLKLRLGFTSSELFINLYNLQ